MKNAWDHIEKASAYFLRILWLRVFVLAILCLSVHSATQAAKFGFSSSSSDAQRVRLYGCAYNLMGFHILKEGSIIRSPHLDDRRWLVVQHIGRAPKQDKSTHLYRVRPLAKNDNSVGSFHRSPNDERIISYSWGPQFLEHPNVLRIGHAVFDNDLDEAKAVLPTNRYYVETRKPKNFTLSGLLQKQHEEALHRKIYVLNTEGKLNLKSYYVLHPNQAGVAEGKVRFMVFRRESDFVLKPTTDFVDLPAEGTWLSHVGMLREIARIQTITIEDDSADDDASESE